jgi:hypothetical protein
VTGFDAAAFSVDPGQFANDLAGGSFAVGLAAKNRDIELTFTPVPEPATAALLALGFLPLVTRRRRK